MSTCLLPLQKGAALAEPPSSGSILDQIAAQPISSWGALKDLSKVVRRAVQEWVVEERAQRGLKADRVRPGMTVHFRVQQAASSACLGVPLQLGDPQLISKQQARLAGEEVWGASLQPGGLQARCAGGPVLYRVHLHLLHEPGASTSA